MPIVDISDLQTEDQKELLYIREEYKRLNRQKADLESALVTFDNVKKNYQKLREDFSLAVKALKEMTICDGGCDSPMGCCCKAPRAKKALANLGIS
jgi:hypothetical protein